MGAWLDHWIIRDFWDLVWPNAGAVPLCAIVGGIGAFVFRDRIGQRLVRWWHKHHTAHLAELERNRAAKP